MSAPSALEILRGITLIASAVIFLVLAYRLWKMRKKGSRGQILVIAGLLCLLVTTGWDTVDFASREMTFSWRALPLLAGLTLLYIYVLEPKHLWTKRIGRDPFDPKKEGEL